MQTDENLNPQTTHGNSVAVPGGSLESVLAKPGPELEAARRGLRQDFLQIARSQRLVAFCIFLSGSMVIVCFIIAAWFLGAREDVVSMAVMCIIVAVLAAPFAIQVHGASRASRRCLERLDAEAATDWLRSQQRVWLITTVVIFLLLVFFLAMLLVGLFGFFLIQRQLDGIG